VPSSIQQDILAVSRISAVPSILKVVAELTGMRVTMVAKVTADSWTACAAYDKMGFGLEVGTQLDVTTTLCKEVCDTNKAIIIEHASMDPVYATHRTPKLYNIESYIAIPILRTDGEMFGTLCAIDSRPAKLEPKVITALTLFTELISNQLKAEDERAAVAQNLWDERRIGELREQFIAVLGHDLRTPLGGIVGSADSLLEELADASQLETLRGIHGSAAQMSKLIDDVLDFARGRLGGGIHVEMARIPDLTPLVRQAVRELSHAHPGREISFPETAEFPAAGDKVRLRQLLSNIIGNALQHSPAGLPVEVKLDRTAGLTRITVRNGGSPIPPEIIGSLFTPFHRASGPRTGGGLGLGLYIASEIARGHKGTIQAESGAEGTTFTILLPGLNA
jgi:hypothetical protein